MTRTKGEKLENSSIEDKPIEIKGRETVDPENVSAEIANHADAWWEILNDDLTDIFGTEENGEAIKELEGLKKEVEELRRGTLSQITKAIKNPRGVLAGWKEKREEAKIEKEKRAFLTKRMKDEGVELDGKDEFELENLILEEEEKYRSILMSGENKYGSVELTKWNLDLLREWLSDDEIIVAGKNKMIDAIDNKDLSRIKEALKTDIIDSVIDAEVVSLVKEEVLEMLRNKRNYDFVSGVFDISAFNFVGDVEIQKNITEIVIEKLEGSDITDLEEIFSIEKLGIVVDDKMRNIAINKIKDEMRHISCKSDLVDRIIGIEQLNIEVDVDIYGIAIDIIKEEESKKSLSGIAHIIKNIKATGLSIDTKMNDIINRMSIHALERGEFYYVGTILEIDDLDFSVNDIEKYIIDNSDHIDFDRILRMMFEFKMSLSDGINDLILKEFKVELFPINISNETFNSFIKKFDFGKNGELRKILNDYLSGGLNEKNKSVYAEVSEIANFIKLGKIEVDESLQELLIEYFAHYTLALGYIVGFLKKIGKSDLVSHFSRKIVLESIEKGYDTEGALFDIYREDIEDVFSLEEVEKLRRKDFLNSFGSGDKYFLNSKYVEEHKFEFTEEEINDATKRKMIIILKNEDIVTCVHNFFNIREKYGSDIEMDEEMKTAVKVAIRRSLLKGYTEDIPRFFNDEELGVGVDSEIESFAMEAILNGLSLWKDGVQIIVNILKMKEFNITVEEIKKMVGLQIPKELEDGDIYKVKNILQKRDFSRFYRNEDSSIVDKLKALEELDHLIDEEMCSLANIRIKKEIKKKNIYKIGILLEIEKFNIQIDEEIESGVKKMLKTESDNGGFAVISSFAKIEKFEKIIIEFLEELDFSSVMHYLLNIEIWGVEINENIKEIFRRTFIELLKKGYSPDIVSMLNKNILEIDDEIKEIAIKRFRKELNSGYLATAFNFLKIMELDLKIGGLNVIVIDYFDSIVKNKKIKNIDFMLRDNYIKEILLASEELKDFIAIYDKISQSPSQEIQRIRFQLLEQIIFLENPEEEYEKVEDIFIKNNIPLAGKVYKIFEILYPNDNIKKITKNNNKLSPRLTEASKLIRKYTIYNDLLKVHINSGNRNLRSYIEAFASGEEVLNKMKNKGIEELPEKEQEELSFFLRRLKVLFDNSQLGEFKESEVDPELSLSDLEKRYTDLKENLGVKEGQSVSERIVEMYLRPLGYKTMDEILEKMDGEREKSHNRGIEIAKHIKNGKFNIELHDILKSVNAEYVSNILQNGSVSKEFLGSSSDSDMTPFDTDVFRVQEESGVNDKSFAEVLDSRGLFSFGGVAFIIKDRGQFQDTTSFRGVDRKERKYDKDKYEIFHTGVWGKEHYGIRTGFPSTEIDCMVFSNSIDDRKREDVFIEIAQNNFYIPVVDEKGNLIFTPEMYEEYRYFYKGVDEYNGDAFEFEGSINNTRHAENIKDLVQEMKEQTEKTELLNIQIQTEIMKVLEKNGIQIRGDFDTGLLGAQIYNIGSTDRGTFDPTGVADFDYTVRVDNLDALKIYDGIVPNLRESFPGIDNDSNSSGGIFQLRLKDVFAFGQKDLDIDIGFVLKSELEVYSSDNALKDRLEWIQENIGQNEYEQVIANIVLTKRILKAGHAYKKVEHGGFGGIGVENWILAHRGNMLEAFTSFLDAATEKGAIISLDKFQKKYKLIDPGLNLQGNFHDNFIMKLKDNGYMSMVECIRGYLK
ncbi:MAG: hypothetical protein HOE80_01365 [Candidatus Magasanikbacteria bacterium]|jgi:hypothetical protein|nr:hypothetical protein [Candidatus Magasanikbacteria bacterium]MBT4071351.1 hypothetical protein [Candidatus Magasanikbacteria bacterium]